MSTTANSSGIVFPDGSLQPTARGTRQYLATITAATSASISYTSFSDTYNHYDLVFNNIMTTSGFYTCLRYYVSAAFQTTGYITAGYYCGNNNASTALGGQTAYIILDPYTFNVTNGGMSGLTTIYNCRQTVGIKSCWSHLTGLYYTTGYNQYTHSAGFYNGTAKVDGFQIVPTGGNIISGSIDIYGWN